MYLCVIHLGWFQSWHTTQSITSLMCSYSFKQLVTMPTTAQGTLRDHVRILWQPIWQTWQYCSFCERFLLSHCVLQHSTVIFNHISIFCVSPHLQHLPLHSTQSQSIRHIKSPAEFASLVKLWYLQTVSSIETAVVFETQVKNSKTVKLRVWCLIIKWNFQSPVKLCDT